MVILLLYYCLLSCPCVISQYLHVKDSLAQQAERRAVQRWVGYVLCVSVCASACVRACVHTVYFFLVEQTIHLLYDELLLLYKDGASVRRTPSVRA